MKSISQTEPIPLAIVQLATTYRLGTILQSYGLARSARGGCVLFFGVIISIGGVYSVASYGASGTLILITGVFIVILGIVGMSRASTVKKSNLRVYLCDHGLIYASSTGAQPFPWTEIHAVLRSVTRRYYSGVYQGTTCVYTIQRRDGYRIVLNNNLSGIEALGNIISDRVTKVLLPQMIQSYMSGYNIPFGPLSISQQGMGNSREFLPWSQVQAVDVKDGLISVKRQGAWLRWSKVAASEVPNLFVFLALVDYVLKSYGKR